MKKLKVAVPTKAHAGLEDSVSEVFGKAETFTIVEIEKGGQIRNVQVILQRPMIMTLDQWQ